MVFFDLETTGLDPKRNRIIQFAGMAVNHETYEEVETLEVKLKFDPLNRDYVDPGAIEGNCFKNYTAEEWDAIAVPPWKALALVHGFLERHKCLRCVSKKPPFRPYSVARMGGQNIITFDLPFLREWYGARFCPVSHKALDTLQLAVWLEHLRHGVVDVELHLESIRKVHGIMCTYDDEGRPVLEGDAHDALVDLRATVLWAKKLDGMIRQAILDRGRP